MDMHATLRENAAKDRSMFDDNAIMDALHTKSFDCYKIWGVIGRLKVIACIYMIV